jgi:hypothetical protein
MSKLKETLKYVKLKPIVEDLCPDLDYKTGGIQQHVNGKNTRGNPSEGLTEKEKASLKPAFKKVADMLNSEADKM